MPSNDPATDSPSQDIEQQLDELLSQLRQQEPEVVAPSGEEAATEAEAVPAAEADESEDELASQIQAMLDDARAAESPTVEEMQPATTPAEDDTAGDPSGGGDTSGGTPIRAIDEMLAEAADDAMTGEFETVDEVLASARQPEPAAAPAPKAAAAPVMAAAIHAPPAGDAPAAEHDPDAVAGDFETPEELLRASTDAAADVSDADTDSVTQALAGSAAAVACELDTSQGKAASKATTATVIVTCERNLRRFLTVVNRPLDAVSPSTRSLIGWLGLANIFLGGAMLAYVVLHTTP